VKRVCRGYFPLIHIVFSEPLASERFPRILGGEGGLKWEITPGHRVLYYPFGPRALLGWSSSIEAVARFAASVERELGLAIRARRSSSCASPGMDAASPTHSVDLAACPERAAHGVPVGILRDEAGEPLLVPGAGRAASSGLCSDLRNQSLSVECR
jgi:hypothetical protein